MKRNRNLQDEEYDEETDSGAEQEHEMYVKKVNEEEAES